MMMNLYTIKDRAADTFCVPYTEPSDSAARRGFKIIKEDEKSMIGKFPDDYELYYVGSFDSNTGRLIPEMLRRIDNVEERE